MTTNRETTPPTANAGEYVFPYQRTFNAIADAVTVGGSGVGIGVSVERFQKAFNESTLSGEIATPSPAAQDGRLFATQSGDPRTYELIDGKMQPMEPAAQDDPAKLTMTLTLTEREMEALEKVMASKDLSAPAVFRNSFRIYQAVEMGAASVTFHETGPFGLPATIARQDDPAKGLEVVCWNVRTSCGEGGFYHDNSTEEMRAEWRLRGWTTKALTDHATAERQIADLRERLETARIARVKHNRQHHEERMARMDVEADAARVREALEASTVDLEHVDDALEAMSDAGASPGHGTWKFVTRRIKANRAALAKDTPQ